MTPEVEALLAANAPVCVGVSGGKDSHAVAWEISRLLANYTGPKLLIHADLGSVEWADSMPACQRIADRIGWELITARRAAGGMMERWESRWQSSIRRYLDLTTVALVLPWSTPSMRFCTSELKVDPITSAIKRRFGKQPVISITGVRAEESTARAKQPVTSPAAKLPPGSLSWRPIHHFTLQQVWESIVASGVEAHEAYRIFKSSRVSCRFCILASADDLIASLSDPASHAIYQRMAELELTSAFSFQGKWISRLAPHLIPDGSARLIAAQSLAATRKKAEAWIPKHLAFTKGWPHCIPTPSECESLATMRSTICSLYGWQSPYLTPSSIRDRYQQLLQQKPAA
jgi:3'-phosphoadenosine 5'-phosphosulfate sulfotransferase (PAPS reductase)/FAD synthetase